MSSHNKLNGNHWAGKSTSMTVQRGGMSRLFPEAFAEASRGFAGEAALGHGPNGLSISKHRFYGDFMGCCKDFMVI